MSKETIRQAKSLKPGLIVAALVGLAFLPHLFELVDLRYGESFWQNAMIFILMYVAMGQAWNVLGGYAGQLSFGHAAFFGIGAYTSTVLLIETGLTPWVGMLLGAIAAVLVSLAVGYPTFVLRGHYFALATLALGQVALISFNRWDLVNAARGLYLPLEHLNQPEYMMWSPDNKLPYYYVILGIAALSVLTVAVIDRSRLGLYLKAINQDEDGAANLGLDVRHYKLIAMGISAFFTALVGSFFAQYVQYIDPYVVMPLRISVLIVVVALLGGRGSVWGPLLGAAFVILFSEISRAQLGGRGEGLDFILFGLVIMLLAVYEPRGLVALLERFRRRLAWRSWR
ncbi:MAG: branched-chain amino acid ABC transporter permease [Anaerolineae bacterium]